MNARNDADGRTVTGRLLRLQRRSWSEVIALAVLAAPIIWIAGYSMLYSTGVIGLLSKGWTAEHWQAVLGSRVFLSSVFYTGTIAAVVTLLATSAALMLVVWMPELRHSRLLAAALCVPLATPSIVIAFLTYLMLNPGGVLSRMLWRLGLVETPADFPELVNDSWAIGIIVAGSLSQFPILSLYLLKTWTAAGMDRYCRLAKSLGATNRQVRWRVALPMLVRRGRGMFVLCFLWTLGLYEIPLLLGVQHPMMYSVLIQKRSGQFNLMQRPEAFVHATIYFCMLSCGLIVFTLWRRRHA